MYKLHFVKFIINEHGDDDDDYAIVRKKILNKILNDHPLTTRPDSL